VPEGALLAGLELADQSKPFKSSIVNKHRKPGQIWDANKNDHKDIGCVRSVVQGVDVDLVGYGAQAYGVVPGGSALTRLR
jgi:hypothetical protein